MKNLFKRLPTFSADYSGVCNAIQHMRCLIILHGQGGCIGGVSTCDDFEKEKNESHCKRKENKKIYFFTPTYMNWSTKNYHFYKLKSSEKRASFLRVFFRSFFRFLCEEDD